MLLSLCMVLMLCPVTVFAETPSDRYSLTLKFKYGTLYGQTGSYDLGSEYKRGDKYDISATVKKLTGYEPYEVVSWQSDTGESTIGTFTDHDIVLEAVYQVQGSLAVTVDGFKVGNTLADCTYSFESTIPGVDFSEDDLKVAEWSQYFSDEVGWDIFYDGEAFQAGTNYFVNLKVDNKGLTETPAVTINGKTPGPCRIEADGFLMTCTLGTPALPPITIDGPDVVCAQQDYEFTVTPPAGVTLGETFGHDSGFSGSDIPLTIDEDGVGHGVVPAAYYEPAASGFDVNAHGTTANGTPVSTTKHVEVSPEHIYEDGVCGCGAVKTYTVDYDGGAEFGLCMDTKTHGKDLTLRGETFKMDGFVQTGWVDGQGAVYDLGAAYTEDRDATLNPVFEKLVTLTVPYTTTVALGDAGEPGETTFDLTLIDGWGKALTADHMTVTAGVTTGGAGDYTAAMTITGPERTLWRLLSEGAFVRQVNAGEDGWTVDDTVWGVLMEEIPVAYAMGDDATASGYTVYVVPVSIDEFGNYEIDWESIDWQDPQSADMCFTNTYSAHVYELNHDADGHWDECPCSDIQNEEPHQYGDWTVTKEATKTEAGEKEHTCTVCGYTETAEIAKLSGTDTTKPDTDTKKPGTDTKKTEKTETDSVQTGDNSNPTLWLALLGVSAAGVIGTGMYSKRKKGAREK